jgi:hypothetical protein
VKTVMYLSQISCSVSYGWLDACVCIFNWTAVLAGAWDAVVTCFFIDTAHNIVEYIEIIARILKPGGVCFLRGSI